MLDTRFEPHEDDSTLQGLVPPQLRIMRGGRLKLSATARALMSEPARVRLYFAPATNELAVVPVTDEIETGLSYKVQDTRKGHEGEINCASLFTRRGIRRDLDVTFPAHWDQAQGALIAVLDDGVFLTPAAGVRQAVREVSAVSPGIHGRPD